MKKFLSLVLALAMTMSLVTVSAGAKDFTDADDITYVEAVEVMSAIGVIDGDSAGNVNPTAGLTRGAAAKIICNLILGPTTASALNADTAPYTDVPVSNTFAGYIAYCQQQGIISGYADGTFKPSAPLTGYAFMKMLLGALGYDVEVEGYTGSNWSIAVAKRALNIGLDDGLVGEFNGSKYVTREEAMLYAFNTLQATMVEYDSKTNISIGGAEVVIAGSSAKEVAQGTYDNNMQKENLQFAEKYFKDLKKYDGSSDAFERPSTTWKLKKVEIGTYTDTPDLTYTTSVDLGDIYADLGLSDALKFKATKLTADDQYIVYEDGVLTSDTYNNITKGDDKHSIGDNGVLTEVYYDSDDNTAIVVLVNTYVGQVDSVEEATAKADAYITITDKSGTSIMTDDEFETEAFEEDDYVLYTYSLKTGEDCIQSVALAESVTGEVSKYTEDKNAVIDGTKYEYSAMVDDTIDAVEVDVTVYLDAYGYVIFVDDADVNTNNFAYVLKAGVDSNRGGNDKWAKLLYTDGTTEVVTTKDAYGNNGTKTLEEDEYTNLVGNFVSYKTNSSNKVVLTKASDTYAVNESKSVEADKNILVNGSSKMDTTITNGTKANTSTLFLLYSADDGDAKVYTGIKNVPDVTSSASTTVGVLSKGGANSAKIVVVYTDTTNVTNASTDVLFLLGDDSVEKTVDADGEYYVFDAVLNGEITEVSLDATAAENTSYIDKLTAGTNVVATEYTEDDGLYTITAQNKTIGDGTAVENSVGAITKVNGDVITVNATDYVVADDVVVYKISTAGKITLSSTSALRDDDNIGKSAGHFQQVSVVFNDDEEVTTIFLEMK